MGNNLRQEVTVLFNRYKRKNGEDEFISIPIEDDNSIMGFLKPITYGYDNVFPETVSLMSKWRKENPSLSNSIFEITDERTKKWLDRLILERADRLLFFIDELDGRHVGHIAYSSFDFENRTCEIDAVLRGEEVRVKGIMTYTIMSMIRWLNNHLKLDAIQLRVNEDNEKALNLYHRCGFIEIKRIPLYRRELEGEIRWDEDENRDPQEAERYELLMRYVG